MPTELPQRKPMPPLLRTVVLAVEVTLLLRLAVADAIQRAALSIMEAAMRGNPKRRRSRWLFIVAIALCTLALWVRPWIQR
jgi:hypothetical protein